MIMIVAITACAVCLVMALVRTALGPTAFDRVLAVNAIGTLVILGLRFMASSWNALNLLILRCFTPF